MRAFGSGATRLLAVEFLGSAFSDGGVADALSSGSGSCRTVSRVIESRVEAVESSTHHLAGRDMFAVEFLVSHVVAIVMQPPRDTLATRDK